MNKSSARYKKYSLVYTKSVFKDIKKLDRVVQKKLKKKLELFCQKPLQYSKKLVGAKIGSYQFRAGNYRIIFDLSGKNIIILRVGHRREIYR